MTNESMAVPPASEAVEIPAPEPTEQMPIASLSGAPQRYLSKLLGSIADMLAYARANSIALPEELRGKIGTLLQDPDVVNDPAAARFGE